MLQSLIIEGADEKGREKKAEELLGFAIDRQKNNPDFLLITPKTTIGIEEVRNLQEWLLLKPYKEKIKSVLVKEAQFLTPEAQNALLKTLEEPPPKSKIILCVSDRSLLLPTIVSRCEIIELPQKPQLDLNKEEIENEKNLFLELLSLPINQRFEWVEKMEIIKEREKAMAWIDKLTFILREFILSSKISPLSVREYLQILSSLNQYKNYLKANANVRLSVENLLLELPLIKKSD